MTRRYSDSREVVVDVEFGHEVSLSMETWIHVNVYFRIRVSPIAA